mmetsp:Transcript_11717/g.24748  ORF Transcript_11717/g.24748 Transcript_11717/m.24748 type:complete len:120 (+) Transcript_11717:208-567(+)
MAFDDDDGPPPGDPGDHRPTLRLQTEKYASSSHTNVALMRNKEPSGKIRDGMVDFKHDDPMDANSNTQQNNAVNDYVNASPSAARPHNGKSNNTNDADDKLDNNNDDIDDDRPSHNRTN